MNKITYEIRQSFPCCDGLLAQFRIFDERCWTEGLGEYRIRFIAGNKYGILDMRTNCRYWSVVGEARKYFSTLLGKEDNESALLVETMNKFDDIVDEK